MSKKILIAAQRAEYLRVAIVDGTTLEDYQVEMAEAGLSRGNIYRGTIANVQPSLNAAFIDIGEERHGFLPFDDVLPEAYHKKVPEGERRPRIEQVLERSKPILVQVTKDGSGQKGPALTTNLSLAGRYLVLTPMEDMRGISRKVEDEAIRRQIKERIKELTLPEGFGVIVRTNGLEQNKTTLNRDLSALLRLWKRIKEESAKGGKGPRLLYTDQDLIVQVLRDYLDSSIEEVIVDDDTVFEKAEGYMRAFMPRSKTQLTRYKERLPLFNRYHLETQIDRIYERTVALPSGGSIVIDGTEALTAIDVNSGRANQASTHDETILNVNVEAAQEVGRQLRLRDIGGLVVVDFIDMRLHKHQRRVEKEMRDAMKNDKARSTTSRISPNGLMEINRQRIKQAIRTRTHRPCPTCSGVGAIPSPEFIAMSLLSRIEARAASGLIRSVTVALHPEITDALQNTYRHDIAALEDEFDLDVQIISAPSLHRTEERIEWGRAATSTETKPRPAALRASDLAAPEPPSRQRKRPAAVQPPPPETDDEEEEDDEPLPAETVDETAEVTSANGAPHAGTGEGRKRRRRGGRRRRGRAGEAAAELRATETSEAAPAAAPEELHEEASEETSEPPVALEGAPRKRRRRGGRRRRRNGGETNGGEHGETHEAAEPAENGGEPEPHGPRRYRDPREGRFNQRGGERRRYLAGAGGREEAAGEPSSAGAGNVGEGSAGDVPLHAIERHEPAAALSPPPAPANTGDQIGEDSAPRWRWWRWRREE